MNNTNNNINNNNNNDVVLDIHKDRRYGRNATKELVVMAIFIGLQVVLGDVIAPIKTQYMKISFGYISLIIAAMYLGPVRTAIVGALADLVGYFGGYVVGAFNPLFTLNAVIAGLISGYFLEGKKSSDMKRVVAWSILHTVLISMILTTTWLVLMYSNGDFSKFIPRLIPRLPNEIFTIVAKIVVTPIIYNFLFKHLRLDGVERRGIR